MTTAQSLGPLCRHRAQLPLQSRLPQERSATSKAVMATHGEHTLKRRRGSRTDYAAHAPITPIAGGEADAHDGPTSRFSGSVLDQHGICDPALQFCEESAGPSDASQLQSPQAIAVVMSYVSARCTWVIGIGHFVIGCAWQCVATRWGRPGCLNSNRSPF